MIWETENAKIILQDVIVEMLEIPDNSFDLCIADPPYGASTKVNW
jgi:DNA modification methylase